jgi:hypothetical protein
MYRDLNTIQFNKYIKPHVQERLVAMSVVRRPRINRNAVRVT